MPWRRREPLPELPLEREEVLDIFIALADIKAALFEILRIVRDDEDEEEADER